MINLSYSIALTFASFISIFLGFWGYSHRDKPGMAAFSIFMFLSAIWPLAQAFDIATADLTLKIFLMKIRLDASVFAGLAFLVMVLQLLGKSEWIKRDILVVLSIIPIMGMFFNWISPNILFRYDFFVNNNGPFPILGWSNGLFFWIWWFYAIALILVPLFLLARSYGKISPLSSRQIIILISAISLPFFTNIIFVIGNISPIKGFNLAPVTQVIMGLIIAWGVFYYRAFNTVPVARGKLISDMKDGMVVLDPTNYIADINTAAEEILKPASKKVLGRPAMELFAHWPDLINILKDVKEDATEIEVEGENSRYYDIGINTLKDKNGTYVGRMILLRDITLRKHVENELKKSETKYRAIFENTGTAMLIIEEDSTISLANAELERLLGYSKKELEGKRKWIDFVAKDDFKGVKKYQQLQRNDPSAVPKNFDFQLSDRYDNVKDVHVVIDLIPDTKKSIASILDITERKKMEKTIRESEKRYSITLDAVNEGIWDWDVSSGDGFFSPNYYKLLGYKPGEFNANYASWRLLVHPDDIDSTEKELLESIKSGRGFEIDLRMKTKSDQWLWVSTRGKVIEKDSTGKSIRMVGTLSDITERVHAEEKINKSLEEKEMLLKEIHHRVKNNLMIISSLLNLQSQYIKDKTSKDIFKESQNRARSMALIHERLYQATDLKRIDFGDYIRTLSNELFRTYSGDFGLIELKINVEDIFLDINTAIPLGLIVNELITNSLKHAFPEDMKGEINVDFHKKDNQYEFTVKDNGIGFPTDLDFKNTDSLGLQIINNLTNQIDGEITLEISNGTEFTITFKELGL